MASVFAAVEAAIGALPASYQVSWPAQVALSLASEIDAEPNAAMARELRSTMQFLMADAPAQAEVDAVDDIAAARDRRRASRS